jgi:hypothetical protein
MTQSQPLLDFLHGLISDGAVRARFTADPAGTLASGGVVATSPQAVYDALVRIGDDQDLAQGFDRGATRGTDVLHVPPPPPPEFFGEHDAHDAAVHYLDNYVSSSFDDDLGPFTGSSAEHGVEVGDDRPADELFGHPVTGDAAAHDVGDGHDYSAHDGAQDYGSHDYNSQADGGSDTGHHGGFDAGGL